MVSSPLPKKTPPSLPSQWREAERAQPPRVLLARKDPTAAAREHIGERQSAASVSPAGSEREGTRHVMDLSLLVTGGRFRAGDALRAV